MTFAIQAENLGKSYLIGHRRREPYQTLRESLVQGVKGAWTRLRHPNLSAGGSDIEEFWALRDVSFEIQPGDRVGIIGRNGAGKSTLLKILSRITEPTTGRFVTRGRVAALLEVGTGFHPELSGRENIYLNGAILGMSRSDVKRQFDAIVDFAGVEKFLDTPVKRYSSGMYVRLAFAVAAHLEPDILIVDEVLAVGDAEFQKKCLGKMEEVGKEGRTVVFVSHNMGAIRRLCDKGMVVDGGRVNGVQGVGDIIQQYNLNHQSKSWSKFDHSEKLIPFLMDANLVGQVADKPLYICDETIIAFTFFNPSIERTINLTAKFYCCNTGHCAFMSFSHPQRFNPGQFQFLLKIPANTFNAQSYYLDLLIVKDHSEKIQDYSHILVLELSEVSRDVKWNGHWEGITRPKLEWVLSQDKQS